MLIRYIKAQNKIFLILKIQEPCKLIDVGSKVHTYSGQKVKENSPYFSSSTFFFYLRGRVQWSIFQN